MNKRKAGDIASGMMFVWLAFYVAALFIPKWADFIGILGCTVPMLAFKQRTRGKTFGTRDCNTAIYTKQDYAAFFAFCISGCALLSAIMYLLSNLGGAQTVTETATRSDFFYLLVFSCCIPAFFEEWMVRGGVLGALEKYGAAGVWMCAIVFALMHISPVKWVYTLFAGLLITALVYLTKCIYLGMLLHFCNNFASLLLSYLPSGTAEAIALIAIAAVFVSSFLLLARGKLFADTVKLLHKVDGEKMRELLTPLFWLFAAAVIVVNILSIL